MEEPTQNQQNENIGEPSTPTETLINQNISNNNEVTPDQSNPVDNDLPPNKTTSTDSKKIGKTGIITIVILSAILAVTILYHIQMRNFYESIISDYASRSSNSTIENNNHSSEEPKEEVEKPATTSEGLPDCTNKQDEAETNVCKTIANIAEYVVEKYYSTDGQIVLDYNYVKDTGAFYKPDYLITATSSISGHRAYTIQSRYQDAYAEYLLDNGFNEIDITISGGGWVIPTYVNYENNVICDGSSIFTCNSIEWYPSENSENAKLLNDLATTAINAEGWGPGKFVITASTNDIKDSEFSPYQTIDVSGTNAAVSFYRISPSSEWRWGYETQSMLLCSEFDNIDKQKAYASMPCTAIDQQKDTTVKEYYNL